MTTHQQILHLLSSKNLSGPQMCRALKRLGNGSMHHGLLRISSFLTHECQFCFVSGLAIGGLGASAIILSAAWLYKRQNKSEAETISKALKDSLNDDNAEQEGFLDEH